MKILITGICGFAGSSLARALPELLPGLAVAGVDNLMRPGAHLNRAELAARGVTCFYGDIRDPADLENLPPADWIVDAAACPSVMAGVDGSIGSRQLLGHNLAGTVNLLELCRRWNCGLAILSTSRVYSIAALTQLPLEAQATRFVPAAGQAEVPGLTDAGIAERFPTTPPISLYGASKLSSEILALEYGAAFRFPVIINRCGVLAGAGQFGRADQGIFAYWIHASREKRPLQFIGFDGAGRQVRDCLHPCDLAALLARQMQHPPKAPAPFNVSGGMANSASLAELDAWCQSRFGRHTVAIQPANRPFDVPWLVLDSAAARREWDWQPSMNLEAVYAEIADFAERHPDWLALT